MRAFKQVNINCKQIDARRVLDYTPDDGYEVISKAAIRFRYKRRDSFECFNVLDYALSTDEDEDEEEDEDEYEDKDKTRTGKLTRTPPLQRRQSCMRPPVGSAS